MQIILNREDAQLYQCKNSYGQVVTLGNNGLAVSPMESLLMAGAACASVDLEIILQKMQQPYIDFYVKVSAERIDDAVPKVFKKIYLEFVLYGKLDDLKVSRALDLSVEKYCSVLNMLGKTAEISYGYILVDET